MSSRPDIFFASSVWYMTPNTSEHVFLAWLTVRRYICEDIRRHISNMISTCRCRRCGNDTNTRRRIRACFVDGECLCFTCYHRARWPRL